ncbi:hypothetical protein D8674_007102 [Pyrus ussuriensis x Pyrus communis]|uniref:Uncharacterized protein n=1 Tax=Pyrus ussuriensis x Pyrus communis TaxID=2448454 RepID=A0A5N5FW74_9ROSA|nr:hypothetical protein D8674_007102 [Pyrus ussuriensis x Pyrus communis]
MDSFMMIIILIYDEVMPNDASQQNLDPPTPDIQESSLAQGVHRPSDKDDGRGDHENVSIDDENIISILGDDDGRIHSLPQGMVDRDDFVVLLDHLNRSSLVVGRHDHEANLKLLLYTNLYSKFLTERYDRTEGKIIVLTHIPISVNLHPTFNFLCHPHFPNSISVKQNNGSDRPATSITTTSSSKPSWLVG